MQYLERYMDKEGWIDLSLLLKKPVKPLSSKESDEDEKDEEE